ncbi:MULTISPECIES: ATP-binding protein [unclassified Lentimonas]|uniref:ATP-binding protein n=1 Tax=unclassified Lentimonas TaxID=2630993 RepID=UPI00132122EB|nr:MULTISPECIES: ATP-binding protein [unclassified Lentimonas]CAA6676328.1 Unannotated [Lentimonas sp. CC4]CAA6683782.1 Unannotated [Lentimonas sp. CC6]CAA7077823.1 Unannotated [Lentimonas sp. CC4]CAA7169753.1 Unannotated [Lentimonas sp. CC21]CAA7179871.1 Unannotated [Lentimonas sp. CC8]
MFRIIQALIAITLVLQTMTGTPLDDLSLPTLEQRLEAIDTELASLARHTLRRGSGSIGFRSKWQKTAEHSEWIEIDLGREVPIDEIALVPILWRDSEDGFRSDAFPEMLRVTYGTGDERPGTLMGELHFSPHNQSIAPRIIPANRVTASWIRIEAPRLNSRAFDGWYVLQFSEIMIFSDSENVALRRPVTVSSKLSNKDVNWNERFLVDGHMPYLMDTAQEKGSLAFLILRSERASLMIDLGHAQPISRIHLHEIEKSDTVPQIDNSSVGTPPRMRLEGANSPNFSDAVTLLETNTERMINQGPILMWPFPETVCRYIRIVDDSDIPEFRIGFAEIEIFSNKHNVARGVMVQSDPPDQRSTPSGSKASTRSLSTLTDGKNLTGNILPIREWLNQLARRQALEVERTQVATALDQRYTQQKANLRRMSWLAALLAAGISITLLTQKIIRQKVVFRTRERIAANLHDELGANLHAIGLFGNLAQKEANKHGEDERWSKLVMYVDEVRTLTKKTGETARYCTNMLEAKEIHEDIVGEIRQMTEHLLIDLEHTLSITCEPQLQQLKPRKRADLYLFYKECLTNIIRHSEATKVETRIALENHRITLTVTDNGCGFTETPKALKRRARLLGAELSIEKPDTRGTYITLQLRKY